MYKVLTLCLFLVFLNAFHVLNHFHRDIHHIQLTYHRGDTSQVFSIFMKMLLQTKTLSDELQFQHPIIP